MSYAYVDSYFVSDKYRIFCELGYPELDINVFNDGSWAILEMINAPVIPCLTKFKYILKGMKNIEFNRSFAEKFVKQIDPRLPEFWEREIKKTMKLEQDSINHEKFVDDLVEKTVARLRKNDALNERVAKYGPSELLPEKIAFQIYKDSPAIARGMGIEFDKVTKE